MRCFVAATSWGDRIGLRRSVGGGGETSARRRGRTGTAVTAPRAAPDGPPTDSEHAAEPMDLPFGLWTRVGRKKHKFNRIRQMAPMCSHAGHIGAIWRIRLNHPSAAATRSYVKLV